MDVLWPLEPATAAKHRLYRCYLDAWWPILLQPNARGFRWPRVTYVDAFAGPGQYEGGEDGSPVFVLDRLLHHGRAGQMGLSRDRVRLVFIEKIRSRYDHLMNLLTSRFGCLDDLPVRVDVRHGDAAEQTARALTELGAWGYPVLAIFDSWGNVSVPLSLINRLARNKATEVIVTFGPNWFNRREELNPDLLDLVFGGRACWTPADRETRPDERWRAWLNTYRDALGRAGFGYGLQFEIVPHTGQPLHLVYGTGHPSGLRAMKDAMWTVDRRDGLRFKDPRTRGALPLGQMDLWSGADACDPELLELVTQRLAEGTVTLEGLQDWLLRETAQWRSRDAAPAVRELQQAGQLTVAPPGRLVKASRIRPR